MGRVCPVPLRMHILDLTLDSAAANVALDEALLEEAEATSDGRETLRLWEPTSPLVVIGRSSRAGLEVRLDYCRMNHIPVLRRASGGAAIITGPGCLMYALVLCTELRPELRSLDETHRFVLDSLAGALRPEIPDISRQGTSDLAIVNQQSTAHAFANADPRKVSGNSVRVKRRHVLYHGTLLYNFPLEQISACLATAPRQPAYRAGRDHDSFVANLPITAERLRTLVINAWSAHAARTDWPHSRVDELLTGKYQTPEWTIEV